MLPLTKTTIFFTIQRYLDTILTDIPYERMRQDGYGFSTSINRRIENRQYDVIFTARDKAKFFDGSLLGRNYTLVDEIDIWIFNRSSLAAETLKKKTPAS